MVTHILNGQRAAVVVEASECLIPLLRLIDRGSGIVFIPNPVTNLEDGEVNRKVKDEHITVHPNRMVHHTFNLDDEEIRKVDYATLLENEDFAFLVSTQIVTKNYGRVPFVMKNKYSRYDLTGFDDTKATLAISYCVAAKGENFPCLLNLGISLFEMRLSELRVGIYYTYINIPSIEHGSSLHQSTSVMRVNDGVPFLRAKPLRTSMEILGNMVEFQLDRVIARQIALFCKFLETMGVPQDELNECLQNVEFVNTSTPIEILKRLGANTAETLYGPKTI